MLKNSKFKEKIKDSEEQESRKGFPRAIHNWCSHIQNLYFLR